MEQLQSKNYFSIDTTERLQLDQHKLLAQDHQLRRYHVHRGGNGRPLINKDKRLHMRQLFDVDVRLSLRTDAAEAGLHHTNVWHFLGLELKCLWKYEKSIRFRRKRTRWTFRASN